MGNCRTVGRPSPLRVWSGLLSTELAHSPRGLGSIPLLFFCSVQASTSGYSWHASRQGLAGTPYAATLQRVFFEKPLLINAIPRVTFVVSPLIFRNTACVTGFPEFLLCAASRVTQCVTRATSASGTDCASSGTSAAPPKEPLLRLPGINLQLTAQGLSHAKFLGKSVANFQVFLRRIRVIGEQKRTVCMGVCKQTAYYRKINRLFNIRAISRSNFVLPYIYCISITYLLYGYCTKPMVMLASDTLCKIIWRLHL